MIHKIILKNSISFDHHAGVVLNILETGSVHAARVYSFHVSVIVLQ